ncbi:uncharacterized protein LOC124346274 isoform X2 [Daphnia pulicaria]|uniref:uncharacterized protein LOC124346274 isoform X2 n=1 Tax=Daphnia pulicaria TaxID=35523 RepID=UPI001EEBEE81|nr:uncharacterized protein LOC124346274 isoform X2 [Daphnia pulicaria]
MGKRSFILRYEMLILFCVFSAFNIASHTKASIAEDSQTNPVNLSLPVETNRTRRSIIGVLGLGTSLLSFTTRELQSISQNINILGLSIAYAQHEKKIKDNLLALQQYLEHPSDHYRDVFVEQGKHLNQEINYLVDGLLGQNRFSPDIMAAIRNAAKCHGQKMRKNFEFIFSIIMTGLWVHGEYQRIIENTQGNERYPPSLIFKKYIMDSQMKLTERLDDMLVECQADEGNVSHEMRQILKATSDQSKKSVADSLLEFLENKYDTKRWIVVLLSKKWSKVNKETWDEIFEAFYIDCSKGFHKTTYKSDFAVAVSVDKEGDFSATRTLMDSHFKEFEIPLWTVCIHARSTNKLLRQFWIPILTVTDQLDVESLSVAQTGFENVITVASKGAKYVWLPTSNVCGSSVLVIPRTPIVPKSACSYNPVRAQKSGRLRNLDGQGYLSVKYDSSQEGAYVILEQESRRSPGQTWTFVNNQLRNGFGKCLTAWTSDSWYLYQYDCHHNWPGQKWTRRGLHFRNGYNFCLDGSSRNRYAIQNFCRSGSSFMWQNLDTDC